MIRHQFGDHYVQICGQSTRLRLTLGALALLSLRLGITGPTGLAQLLRKLSPAEAQTLLFCLIHSCDGQNTGGDDRQVTLISDAELAAALPIICTLFEEAFRGPK